MDRLGRSQLIRPSKQRVIEWSILRRQPEEIEWSNYPSSDIRGEDGTRSQTCGKEPPLGKNIPASTILPQYQIDCVCVPSSSEEVC